MTDAPEKKNLAERAADLSDAMFESSEARRRDAMRAVRAFVDTVDETIPNVVDPSMRRKSSTLPWHWPISSARRSWSSCAASRAA